MTQTMYEKVEQAKLEEKLCLAVLIAVGSLSPDATLEDANRYWEKFGCCGYCPHFNKCLAVIINQ